MKMADRLTITSVEHNAVLQPEAKDEAVSLVPHDLLVASMQQAIEAVSDTTNSYSLNSLAQREEMLAQRRRIIALAQLEAEEDALAGDLLIEREVVAGAHLDELHTVVTDLHEGRMVMTQSIIDDVVGLMVELRGMMAELPQHVVAEIKDVARPLRQAINEFQNRIEVV